MCIKPKSLGARPASCPSAVTDVFTSLPVGLTQLQTQREQLPPVFTIGYCIYKCKTVYCHF